MVCNCTGTHNHMYIEYKYCRYRFLISRKHNPELAASFDLHEESLAALTWFLRSFKPQSGDQMRAGRWVSLYEAIAAAIAVASCPLRRNWVIHPRRMFWTLTVCSFGGDDGMMTIDDYWWLSLIFSGNPDISTHRCFLRPETATGWTPQNAGLTSPRNR